MVSEYCWMEPANGCRICMRILSGSGKTPWVWSNGGLARRNLRSPPASPRYPTTGQRNAKLRGYRRDRHESRRKWPAAFTLGSGADAQWLPSSRDLIREKGLSMREKIAEGYTCNIRVPYRVDSRGISHTPEKNLLDLANPAGEFVEITPESWRVGVPSGSGEGVPFETSPPTCSLSAPQPAGHLDPPTDS